MAMAKGTVTISVLYPRDDTSTFDMDYYLSTHMRMAEKAWSPHGMLSWSVIEIPSPPGGAKAPFSVHSLVTWEAKGENGMDGVMAGMTCEAGKELAADVSNFSNRVPEVVMGTVKASGSVQ